jgi:hypothetical protein
VRVAHRFLLSVLLLVALGIGTAHADPGSSRSGRTHSTKARWIGVLAGTAAGFAAGLTFGLARFDDDIDSERKVWTSAVAIGAGGGVAGYFVGAAIDRRSRSQTRETRELPLSALPASSMSLLRRRSYVVSGFSRTNPGAGLSRTDMVSRRGPAEAGHYDCLSQVSAGQGSASYPYKDRNSHSAIAVAPQTWWPTTSK